jgi:AraC-like DNA-binding protein
MATETVQPRASAPGPAATLRHSRRNGIDAFDFESTDPDETRDYVRRWGDHYRKVSGSENFRYCESGLATGRVVLGRLSRTFDQTLRAATFSHTVVVDLQPGQTFYHSRRAWDLGPRCAVLCAPGQEYMRRGGAGACMVVNVQSSMLEEALAARVNGRSRHLFVQSALLQVSPERLLQFSGFQRQVRHAFDEHGSWGAYGELDFFERAVADWLAEWIVESAAVRAISRHNLHRIVELERWIDAHLGEPLTLDRLCGVARLSTRSLQKTLLSVRGMSPIELVQRRRLAAARKRLLERSADELISNIALDCGFQHLGRFSLSYRESFGESPRDTTVQRQCPSAVRGTPEYGAQP